MMWEIFLNGRSLGIIETNWPWASKYWRGRCTKEKRYMLRELSA